MVDGQDVRAVKRHLGKVSSSAPAAGEWSDLSAKRTHIANSGHHVGDINREYYRSKSEEQRWKNERDPIQLHAKWLTEHHHADSPELERISKEARDEMEAAVKFAINAPYPSVDQVREDIYA